MNFSESELIEVKARVESVLDLTNGQGRKVAFEAVVENPNASDAFIAEELIEEPTGGTILTDRIGYWTAKQKYEAILYLAPRVVWGPDKKANEDRRLPKPWDYDLFPLYEQGIRDHLELNLVVFSRHWDHKAEPVRD